MSIPESSLRPNHRKGKPATSSKKHKWREIEQLKEKFALEKELKMCEYSLEYMLDER